MGLATFELPDLGPESNNDCQDDEHRDTESSATEAQFVKGFDTALVCLGAHAQPRLDSLLHRGNREGMYGSPRFDERGLALLQFELGLADLHTSVFGSEQNIMGLVVGLLERIEVLPHIYCHLPPCILSGVTGCTDRAGPKAQHRAGCRFYSTIGVTDGAARDSQRDQDGGVGTVVEEVRLHGVTLSADIPYPRDPRRRRAVI